ncbi:alpha-glucosidase-like [Leptopilina heterotoma]|uniref:alpha-glucosidase-like n=1 Tax=Leptopilina heterotoma TaxID=63436 RepID=UPI001CA88601|nr:alpha-glucosidase-like [Leptopilina heterotoma]
MTKLTLLCISLAVIHVVQAVSSNDWWKDAIIYQIYPRSFKDSNGDGIGDLNGITSKLEHVRDIGADALWLSPIYTSPQVDFGYDVANFTDVDPQYGTLADFDRLAAKAKKLGLKVILDFVPNHSSNEHEWFKMSVERIKPYVDFYVWRDAKIVNGVRKPPNNWLSAFGGSAWEWNEQRGQYYLHQFAIGQPDLNYYNVLVYDTMTDVLKFWMDRGADGFRIDAVNHMFEDVRMLDEPRNNNNVPIDDYDSLDHIYTKDQIETYEVIKAWRNMLNQYSEVHNTDGKFIVTEAYTNLDEIMKYFQAGANPFNFAFISSLNDKSVAKDFEREIKNWLENIPNYRDANWVTGNHDNHRIATRYGAKKSDMVIMLSMVLPGFCVVYNGDEIGMVNKFLTWEETRDISGCNAGPDRYFIKSRDPERTPFQWDDSVSGGFSTSEKTWLPVHENYKTLNLKRQKLQDVSNYKFFKSLTNLRKNFSVIKNGDFDMKLMSDNVLVVLRSLEGLSSVVLVINTAETEVVVDVNIWLNIPKQMVVYSSNVDSKINIGSFVDTSSVKLPASGSVVLVPKL